MNNQTINRLAFLLMVLSVGLSSCYYDVEEELYPDTGCATDDLSYANDIQPIFEQHCYVCHSAAAMQGNVVLEGYENLKTYVDNGRLQGAINHEPGFSPMPQGQPKLVECTIEKIEVWIQDGALDN